MTHQNLMSVAFRRVKLLFPVMVTWPFLNRFIPNFRLFKSPCKWWRYLCNHKTELNYNVIIRDYLTESCPQFCFVFFGQRFHNLRRAAFLTSLIQYDGASFQIWWTAAGYGELCVWFQPIRNGETFWMNNKKTAFNTAKGTVRKGSWAWKRSKLHGIQSPQPAVEVRITFHVTSKIVK